MAPQSSIGAERHFGAVARVASLRASGSLGLAVSPELYAGRGNTKGRLSVSDGNEHSMSVMLVGKPGFELSIAVRRRRAALLRQESEEPKVYAVRGGRGWMEKVRLQYHSLRQRTVRICSPTFGKPYK